MATRFATFAGWGGAAVLAAFLPASLPAQAPPPPPFEGVIAYRLEAGGQSLTMRYLTKGGKIRQELEAPGMPGPVFLLLEPGSQVVRTVMPSMGMYMEIDVAQAEANLPAPAAPEKAKLTKVGTSHQIAGIACEDYRFGEAQDLEACVATGMGWFMSPPNPRGGGGPGMPSVPDFGAYRREFQHGMLPLRLRRLQGGGGRWETILEATAVEKKTLEPSLFELPAGLRKIGPPGGGR